MNISPITIPYTNKTAFRSDNFRNKNIPEEKPNTQRPAYPRPAYLDSSLYGVKNALFFSKLYNPEPNVPVPSNTYDSFTGLRDKNYLLSELNLAMHDAQVNNKNLSIAMFDMDNFKSVNELLGYETGDFFIKEISQAVKDVSKENHVDAYRFGGEEFVLIFDGQSDEEKKKIAQAISYQANNNSKIQSYRALYLRNAQIRLDKSIRSTQKVTNLSELKTKKATIEQIRENLTIPGAKDDDYLIKTLDDLSLQINQIYSDLINECLANETDDTNRYLLSTVNSKLKSNVELLETEERAVDEYLYSVYDKSNEIYQTRKWLSDFKNNNGFGITCGIVNFEPDALENKSPMDIIDKTGNILKKGKNKGKGRVYLENVSV